MPDANLDPLPSEQFDFSKARHLLNRAGFGGSPGQVRELANMGVEKAVAYLVDYGELPYEPVHGDDFDHDIMRPPTREERQFMRRARKQQDEEGLSIIRKERQRRQKLDRGQIREMQQWWLNRMIKTGRPLEEKMTLFWHGHFATGYRTIEDSYHMFMQNQLFRKEATGSFKKLAHGIIRDPAMLRYLNNNQNRKQKPNENLARELMELFTLGEGNDYTENDIKQGARALTGYNYRDDEFIYAKRMHDDGAKEILGQVGAWNGDDFVDIILNHRAVSEFLCWKLYRFFVNDNSGTPEEAPRRFIIGLGKLLRNKNYELKPVLHTLFRSRHFYDPQNMGTLIKSPIQLMVQAIRDLRTPVRSLDLLLKAADLMGQNIFQPPSVKGWDGGRVWINTSTLFIRKNILVYLLTGRRPGKKGRKREGGEYDAMHLVEHLQTDQDTPEVRSAVVSLLRFTLGQEPHEERIRPLVQFVNDRGGKLDNRILIALLMLITAMPEYQLC